MNRIALSLLTVLLVMISCSRKVASDEVLIKKANELAHKYIITDGHVDLPYRLKVQNFRLEKEFVGIPISTDKGDFDYVRSKKGGLDAPFMSIFIPSNYGIPDAKLLADSLIKMVNWVADQSGGKFEIVDSPKGVRRVFTRGAVALPLGMENGSPIGKIEDVGYWRKQGISYVTLTHAKDNQICDSSYDTTRTWNGLSPFGSVVVPELAKEGIMIDVSHISDSAFFDVLAVTPVSLLASHSSARKFTPGFERNMSDEIIEAMGKNNGVIMVNFGSTFIDGGIRENRDRLLDSLAEVVKKSGVDPDSEEGKTKIKDLGQSVPGMYADVRMVADHIDHIVKLAGVKTVGFGSDFDGVGDSLPAGLKDVADYPNLIYELLRRGYTEQDVEEMCYLNLFRVWQGTLDYANNKI